MNLEQQPSPGLPRKRLADRMNRELKDIELPSKSISPTEEDSLIVKQRNEEKAFQRENRLRKLTELKRPPANLNLELISHFIESASSIKNIKMIIQDLFEKPLGDPKDEAHHPGYPWDETPDDIIGAISTYIESEGTDQEALARIPGECGLRGKVEELLPPKTIH